MVQTLIFDLLERAPAEPDPPAFDGVTYSPDLDLERLETQLGRVFRLMRDGAFRTLSEIADAAQGSPTGVSARLRDLRKEKWGSHTVESRRRGDPKAGVWEYRLVAKEPG